MTPDEFVSLLSLTWQQSFWLACSPSGYGCAVGGTDLQTLTNKIALSILARDGVCGDLATPSRRCGRIPNRAPRSAAAILEIAEAADEAWLDARDRLRDRSLKY